MEMFDTDVGVHLAGRLEVKTARQSRKALYAPPSLEGPRIDPACAVATLLQTRNALTAARTHRGICRRWRQRATLCGAISVDRKIRQSAAARSQRIPQRTP
jgi:hypothetical protein